jgi:TRAP-type uncharacterized transport system substrate-binding protein
MMRTQSCYLAVLLLSALLASPSSAEGTKSTFARSGESNSTAVQIAQAQRQTPPTATTAAVEGEAQAIERANTWTVGVAGGLLEGTFIRFAADLAKVLDDGENLRVLPMVTYGAAENVSDLLYLKGVDVSITDADVLEEYKKDNKFNNIDKRIHYISEMYIAELHILARPEIKSLKDLEGKKVGFNSKGSAANITGKIVFDRLHIKVQPVYVNNAIGIEQLKTGELAAILHIVGKPNDLFSKLKLDPGTGFHFLPLEFGDKFSDYYLPSVLVSADYPDLIKSEERINTIGVPVVMAVYNWPKNSDRFRRVERFIQYYFSRFENLRKPPYHPKWQEVNLSAKVPGWTRYWVAEELLAKSHQQPPATGANRGQPLANATMAETVPQTTGDKKLFKEFLEWKRQRKTK